MPFMVLTLAVVVVIVVTAFLGTSPRVANVRRVHFFNAAIFAASIPVAVAVGLWLYGDAVSVKADEKGMATYLALMGGGTAALLLVAVGGLVRNFVVFPRSVRVEPPPDDPA